MAQNRLDTSKKKTKASKKADKVIKKAVKQTKQRTLVTADTPLNAKQELFCYYYVETGNGTHAAIKAGYSEKTATITGSKLLRLPNVNKKIRDTMNQVKTESVASAQEVMEYFTKVMRGEIKDQFGLDAPLSERTRAAQEMAKRTVDVEARAEGKSDAVVKIQLDWSRD